MTEILITVITIAVIQRIISLKNTVINILIVAQSESMSIGIEKPNKPNIKPVHPMTFEKLKAKWQRDKDLNLLRASAVKALLTDECLPVYKNYRVQRVIVFGSLLSKKFNKQLFGTIKRFRENKK